MNILLKNGFLFDGTGEKPYHADILVKDNLIAKIAECISEGEADTVIDVKGCNVSSGFIDAHSHNDFYVTRDDHQTALRPFLHQGITTQIVGNCGFSINGVDKNTKYKELIGGGLFHTKTPSSLQEWVETFEGSIDVNVLPLVGHGSTRISTSGYSNKKLSKEQEEEMFRLLEKDLEYGAWGGSFGLMYEPGMYAKKEELTKFATLIKKYDGILTVHPRACSDISNGFPLLKPHHLELGLREVGDIMEETGVSLQYSHLIFTGTKSWPRLDSMLGIIHDYKKRGFDIAFDMYSYTYGASVITVMLPPDFMATPKEKRNKGFQYLKARVLMSLTKSLLGLSFESMTIAYIGDGYEKYEGKIVSDLAKEEGLSPALMYLKLVELSDGQGRVYIDNYYNEDIIRTLMKDDLSLFMTDAWLEDNGLQNAASYTCFPHFFALGEKHNLPKEYIVRKMTGAIADRFKIPKRGYLKEGYYADITVFGDWKISSETDYPTGLKLLLINGKIAIQDDQFHDVMAGEFVLKK